MKSFWLISCALFCIVSPRNSTTVEEPKDKQPVGKFLLLPSIWSSHIMEMLPIAGELTKRGHRVSMLQPSTAVSLPSKLVDRSGGIEFVYYRSSGGADPFDDSNLARRTVENYENYAGIGEELKLLAEVSDVQCRELELRIDDLVERLRGMKFDVVLVDSFGPSLCLYKLADKLSVPVAALTSVPVWPWLPSVAQLPSITKSLMSDGGDDWSFANRLRNFGEYFAVKTFAWFAYDRQATEIARRVTKVWFVEDDWLMDTKRIETPNVFRVGGLTARPAQPLPAKLEEFISSSATGGVVLVSFGTKIVRFSEDVVRNFAAIFVRMPELLFVWKVDLIGSSVRLSKNVYNATWLPQNDLLGHPRMRLFLTHCGNNGMYEALYHGVPMIGNPINGDQPFNCQRLLRKRFGLTIDIRKPTVVIETINKIRQVLNDKTFAENIQLASRIRRDMPVEPVQRVVNVLEHIFKYGTEHFEFGPDSLSLFEILMLDVVICLVLVIVLPLVLIFYCCCREKRLKIKVQ